MGLPDFLGTSIGIEHSIARIRNRPFNFALYFLIGFVALIFFVLGAWAGEVHVAAAALVVAAVALWVSLRALRR